MEDNDSFHPGVLKDICFLQAVKPVNPHGRNNHERNLYKESLVTGCTLYNLIALQGKMGSVLTTMHPNDANRAEKLIEYETELTRLGAYVLFVGDTEIQYYYVTLRNEAPAGSHPVGAIFLNDLVFQKEFLGGTANCKQSCTKVQLPTGVSTMEITPEGIITT